MALFKKKKLNSKQLLMCLEILIHCCKCTGNTKFSRLEEYYEKLMSISLKRIRKTEEAEAIQSRLVWL